MFGKDGNVAGTDSNLSELCKLTNKETGEHQIKCRPSVSVNKLLLLPGFVPYRLRALCKVGVCMHPTIGTNVFLVNGTELVYIYNYIYIYIYVYVYIYIV